jgi:aflatoxin B1 aldehyde reductase
MASSPDTSTGARITSLETYSSILTRFQRSGYGEIDTARAYVGGKQEAFTRDAKWKERGLQLATKAFPRPPGRHAPGPLEQMLDESLQELGTDCVDIFYLHAADRSVPFTETLQALNEMHKKGKFVQLGLSNFTAFEVAEVVMHCKYNGWVRPTIWQGMYNAITRSIEAELIPTCKRYGIDVVVYNPIAGGIFSGKYKTKDIPAEGRYSTVNRTGRAEAQPHPARDGFPMAHAPFCTQHQGWPERCEWQGGRDHHRREQRGAAGAESAGPGEGSAAGGGAEGAG